MMRYALTCLLLGAMAWGQAPSSAPPNQKPAGPAGTSAFPPDAKDQEAAAAKVAPDAPVITIDGLCEDKTANPCKTVITKEQFEKMVDAIQPNMPARARRQFANRYSNVLVMSAKAHEQGLDQGPKFEQRLQLARVQILSQSLSQSIQEKAAQISDQDIQDYSDKNKADFEEAEVHRIFIPRVQQEPNSKVKLSAAEEAKRSAAGEAAMKAEAAKIRTRAAAGEDFNKLQADAFLVAGIKTKSPTTDMGKIRRSSLPQGQASVMDLKTGAVSELFSDQSGYFVYKVGTKDTPTLDSVKEEIRGTLRSQRMQEQMQAVQKSATTNLDEAYFGPEAPQRPMPGMPGMPPGMGQPPRHP